MSSALKVCFLETSIILSPTLFFSILLYIYSLLVFVVIFVLHSFSNSLMVIFSLIPSYFGWLGKDWHIIIFHDLHILEDQVWVCIDIFQCKENEYICNKKVALERLILHLLYQMQILTNSIFSTWREVLFEYMNKLLLNKHRYYFILLIPLVNLLHLLSFWSALLPESLA